MIDTQVYGVVLPLKLAYKARVVAAIEGKSRSKLIRELLENYLECFDWTDNIDHVVKPSQSRKL